MAKKVAHGQKSGAWLNKWRMAKKVAHGQKGSALPKKVAQGQKSGAWPKKWRMANKVAHDQTKWRRARTRVARIRGTSEQPFGIQFTPLDRGKGEDGSTAPLLSTFATFHQF